MASIGAHTFKGYVVADSTTTDAITLQSTTTVAVFGYWQQTSTPPTITDSKGNTLDLVFTDQVGANSGGNWFGVWTGVGVVGGSSYTVTASKSNGFTSIWVVEAIDADSFTSAFVVDASNPYSHDIVTTGDALVVGFLAAEGNASLTLDATANGFAELDEEGSVAFWQGVTAQKSVAAGTHTFSVAVTGSVLNGGVALLAFATAPPPGEPRGIFSASASTGGAFVWSSKSAASQIINRAFFGFTEPLVGGRLPVWNGTENVARLVKVWDGAAWSVKTAFRWDGAAWMPT